MSYLLDTNVISEAVKPRPDPRVVEWLAAVDEDRVFLSVISLAEIRRGIELMAVGQRRDRLETWLTEDLPTRFEGRILSIDHGAADAWGVFMARARRAGVALSTMDGLFAASATVHALTLVTRNVRDFEALGISLFNPWQDQE